jgi:pyroglutamyl-peptidase
MPTVLVTGFGPFPGAPVNPTEMLVKTLTRPGLAGATIVPHIFSTSYTGVDRDFPKLMARYKPDALLMFGLATETAFLRIETQARNFHAALPDVDGVVRGPSLIAPGRATVLALRTPSRALAAATRRARVPVAVSRDAGGYLCNYLCWRAAMSARRPGGPAMTVFIHVPKNLSAADLARAGRNCLALAASLV